MCVKACSSDILCKFPALNSSQPFVFLLKESLRINVFSKQVFRQPMFFLCNKGLYARAKGMLLFPRVF